MLKVLNICGVRTLVRILIGMESYLDCPTGGLKPALHFIREDVQVMSAEGPVLKGEVSVA